MCLSELSYSLQVRRGGGGAHVCLITVSSFQGQYKLKYFFHFVRLSEMSFSLLVRLDKDLDLCGAISYAKSVGGEMCVYQKCPFRYWLDWTRKTSKFLQKSVTLGVNRVILSVTLST